MNKPTTPSQRRHLFEYTVGLRRTLRCVSLKKRGSTFVIITLEILMDFNNFYISGNGNECRSQVSCLLIYFTCDMNMTSLSHSWWAATASAACVVASTRAVADWWRSWPIANTFACLCSCQWWTFWIYLLTVSLFSLCLMNFMIHTTLDAVGNILTVHYVSFSQGSVSTLFRWGEHVFMCVQKCSSCLQRCKNYF